MKKDSGAMDPVTGESRDSRVLSTAKMTTASGRPPEQAGSAPAPIDPATGQHGDHWVLSEEERAKGFVRPVRDKYKHLKCGGLTRMPTTIAETYSRQPSFYSSTFCVDCRAYLPVGEAGEFVWLDDGTKVGT